MPQELELFAILHRHGVPFVIIGEHAVQFHGYPATPDEADVVWIRSPAAEQSLFLALKELNATPIAQRHPRRA